MTSRDLAAFLVDAVCLSVPAPHWKTIPMATDFDVGVAFALCLEYSIDTGKPELRFPLAILVLDIQIHVDTCHPT